MKIIYLSILASLLVSCSPKHLNQKLDQKHSKEDYFAITVPEGWKEVENPNEARRRALWVVHNYNYSVWVQKPEFFAWDGSDGESFLSCMKIKRECGLGTGSWFSELMPMMKEFGASVQEKGSCTVAGEGCRWWIQTFGEGVLQQKCFVFCHNQYLYIFAFTTRYLSDERQKIFDQIISSITF